jgi:hypothetical protein
MPPAANDNQGLKVAVALLAATTVLLGVATYFGFSESAKNAEALAKANTDKAAVDRDRSTLQTLVTELKEKAGFPKAGDADVLKAIDDEVTKLQTQVAQIDQAVQKVYADFKSAGGAPALPDEFARDAQAKATSFSTEPGRSLQDRMTRLVELLEKQSQLMAAMGADYQSTRKELEAANQIAKQKVDVEVSSRQKAEDDRMAELAKHEEDRRSYTAQLDALQAKNQELAVQLADVTNAFASYRDTQTKEYGQLAKRFRDEREKNEKDESTLEMANGRITYVDENVGEVRTSLTRATGAREQMVFSVFDKDAAGIPSDKVKATIELTRVDNRGSTARIVKTLDISNPIRDGDQIYSRAFSTQPREFALIGTIDMNRDGIDDREDLKRMIASRGGRVTYDLPPPGIGSESGDLSPSTAYYVLDDRPPIRESGLVIGASGDDVRAFETARTKALDTARLSGVRAISLERLLTELGYSYGDSRRGASAGQVEAFDRDTYRRLVRPPSPAPDTPPPSDE